MSDLKRRSWWDSLRVAVITQGISEVLESILESGHEVVGIVESSSSHRTKLFPQSNRKVSYECLLFIYLTSLKFKTFLQKNEDPLLLL